MMGSVDALRVASLLAGLALLVFAVYMIGLQAKLRERIDALGRMLERQDSELDSLRQLIRDINEDGAATREREQALAEHVALLSRQQEQLLIRDSDSGPYFQAIRAARSGASAASLISAYGLSHGEAELVVALHGHSREGEA
jgi:hypothetical protein